MIFAIEAARMDKYWEHCKPFVETALQYADGEISIDDIYTGIMRTQFQLWMVFDVTHRRILGAYVTQVVDYPQLACLRVVTLAGEEFPTWIDEAHNSLNSFARQVQAKRIEVVGRSGWVKKLRRLGFKHAYSM